MKRLEFSAPYNGDMVTLEEVLKLNKTCKNTLREIYLSGPQEYSGSGRVTKKLDLSQLLKTVDRIKAEGIRVNLAINSVCEGSDWYSQSVLNKTIKYLRLLHKEHGVEAVTIANPIIVKEVRKYLPDIEICVSVLGDIDCVQRAVIFRDAGANVLTPDVNINRNLDLLREIKRTTGAELRIMVNEGCLYKCPFRKFHFNYISHVSKESYLEEHFLQHCHQVIYERPSQILKSGWIRPEDIRKYSDITTFFKIVGRALPKSKVIRATKAYLEESWDGDLLEILASSIGAFSLRYATYLDNKSLGEYGFFKKVTSCDRNCEQCNYCESIISKLMMKDCYTKEKWRDVDRYDIADAMERENKRFTSFKIPINSS